MTTPPPLSERLRAIANRYSDDLIGSYLQTLREAADEIDRLYLAERVCEAMEAMLANIDRAIANREAPDRPVNTRDMWEISAYSDVRAVVSKALAPWRKLASSEPEAGGGTWLARWRSIYTTVEEYERSGMMIVPGELAAKMRELVKEEG